MGRDSGNGPRMVSNPFKDMMECVPQAARKKTKRTNAFTLDDSSERSQLRCDRCVFNSAAFAISWMIFRSSLILHRGCVVILDGHVHAHGVAQ